MMMTVAKTVRPRRTLKRRRSRVRGFALPLVILLTLAVGIGLGVLFQRHGVASLAARRQADNYIERHAGLGMREMVSRWMTTVRGRLKDSLEEDGFAFNLELPDGGRIDVSFRDAQGTALSDSSMLTGRRQEIVVLMNHYLSVLPEELRQLATRRHGPSEISIDAASPEVLLALAQSIVGPDKADDVVQSLRQRRDDQTAGRSLSSEQVSRGLSEARVEPEQIAEFQAMLVMQPSLWFVTAEFKTSSGRLIDRAGGLMLVNPSGSNPYNQNGPFLTWEALPLEEATDGPFDR